MSIRIKIRPDGKAMTRFGNPDEQQWYINTMRSIRDSDPKTHPTISIKDHNGEIPRLPPPQKLTPEMLKKMKIQPTEGKPMETKKK